MMLRSDGKDIHRHYMKEALKQALISYKKNEVPVGCIIVRNNAIIASAHNIRETENDPLGHAELIAIRRAAEKLGSWRLTGCTMYVTLEPCIMCTGAIMDSRIERLYIGAPDIKRGAVSSFLPVIRERMIPHNVEYEYMETISPYVLKRFFKRLRKAE